MEQLEPSDMVVGMWNGVASLENSLAIPQMFTMWPSDITYVDTKTCT